MPGWQVLRRRRRYEVLGLQRHCRRLLRLLQRLQFPGGDVKLRPFDNDGGWHGVLFQHRLHQRQVRGRVLDAYRWQVLRRWHTLHVRNVWRHGGSVLRLSFWLPAHCLGVGFDMHRAAARWRRRLCVGRRHVRADGRLP